MKRLIVAMSTASLLAFLLAGCGGSQTDEATRDKAPATTPAPGPAEQGGKKVLPGGQAAPK